MKHKPTLRYQAKVDSAGRVLIPAKIREKFGMKPGAVVTITEGASGRVVLEPPFVLLHEAQQYFKSIAPSDVLWSDELIAERRHEARREKQALTWHA